MLVQLFLKEGDPRLEHILGATVDNDLIPSVMEFPRFNLERRMVMEKCGRIDPEDIHDYIAEGGYAALAKALLLRPAAIIDEIAAAGLRGRGGAGFPTGRKWALARDAAGDEKIVICNADEGDPGAYMDRTILESNPHQVLEGMAHLRPMPSGRAAASFTCAPNIPWPCGSSPRPFARRGNSGCWAGKSWARHLTFDIDLFQGSGAFVCGEETALIQSIEGFRGMPVPRPPYPVQQGLGRQAHRRQQRQDVCLCPAHPEERRRMVPGDRHPLEPRHRHLLRGGQRRPSRPGGNPHGQSACAP